MRLGNAPCSWGVEFADDPRNPPWRQVLAECADAGYRGIELGPVGFLPEDAEVLGAALHRHGLALAGGVVFQPFHDPGAWTVVRDSHIRTCRALAAHGARQVVLIDSISPRRAATIGRSARAPRLAPEAHAGFVARIREAATIAAGEFGLTASLHAHAGGWCEFEDELDAVLQEIDAAVLKVCVDTAHATLAGMDPLAIIGRCADRLSHVHLKDIDPRKRARAVAAGTDFYAACADGLFCGIGRGGIDFAAVGARLREGGYDGWCIVEQDCAPDAAVSRVDMARANRQVLEAAGFAAAAA